MYVFIATLIEQKKKLKVETFNLGTGTGSSVLEVIPTLKSEWKKLPYKIVGRREGDITQRMPIPIKERCFGMERPTRRSDGQCLEMGTENRS
jgi:UDP-glucose 4-epimerase